MAERGPRRARDRTVLAAACGTLLDHLPELVDAHLRRLAAHSAAYGRLIPAEQHRREAHEAMRTGIEAVRAPGAAPRRDLAYAEMLGRRRAGQGLPLDLLVHAYRQAGQLVWERLQEAAAGQPRARLVALMRSATTVWSVVDEQTDTVSRAYGAYLAAESEPHRHTDERPHALLDALLDSESDSDIDSAPGLASAPARAAAGLDLPEHGRYAVVAVRVGPRERREPCHRLVQGPGVRCVWRPRADRDLGVAVLAAGTGLDPLADLLDGGCPGPGGISPVVTGLSRLGQARRLAELALRTCPPDATGVVRLDRRMSTALVAGQPELARLLVADVFDPLLELGPAERSVLLRTLETWLACEGSAGRAAGRLYCHRNTVFNRLRRLERLTSRSLSRPRDLTEMTLALDAHRLTQG
ncbi:helix-turn-helix domain-containing protein [Streptomyces boluensis]|uniref:PucR family transcriptional regulator n=1 Tax=Streptomyces boluensis TaxID=1775135 RepID=A0A964UNV6_9ACTN|nr:helix-turn-helix domain-containing protein [Streptomyces boluensis]NBE52713.1 PucR family transcriptional regulator [Streptomyces boluensis]